jgi:hypothetical protein
MPGIIVGLMLLVAWLSKLQFDGKSKIADLERRVASLKRQLARETRT